MDAIHFYPQKYLIPFWTKTIVLRRCEPSRGKEKPGEAPAPQEIWPTHRYPYTKVPRKLPGIVRMFSLRIRINKDPKLFVGCGYGTRGSGQCFGSGIKPYFDPGIRKICSGFQIVNLDPIAYNLRKNNQFFYKSTGRYLIYRVKFTHIAYF
jgi:hypothetical protein